MRVLVLGSGGKLGALIRSGWPDTDAGNVTWHNRASFDIVNNDQALRYAAHTHDCILVLAGVTPSSNGADFGDNTRIAEAVLDAADGKRVLLTSSAAVYGAQGGTLSETMPGNPVSEYGTSKQAMEQKAAAFKNATCLRIGNVAGADALLGRPRRAYTLHRFANGGYVSRSYIGPQKLAIMLSALCKTERPLLPILNVALPGAVSMAALLDAANLPYDVTPAPPSAIQRVELDTTLLSSFVPLQGGVARAADIVSDWKLVIERGK